MVENNFLSLDLELNKGEIIQVGISIGNYYQDEEDYYTEKWYIKTDTPIEERITALTGITDEDIQNKGVSFEQLARELSSVIDKYTPFVNPVTWGGGDSAELLNEFNARQINFPYFGRRWIDVKTLSTVTLFSVGKYRPMGLRKTMNKFGLPFIGDTHRADHDAYNTLRFFFYLIRRRQCVDQLVFDLK